MTKKHYTILLGIILITACTFGLGVSIVFQSISFATEVFERNRGGFVAQVEEANIGKVQMDSENLYTEGVWDASEIVSNVMPSIVSVTAVERQAYTGFGQQYERASSGSGVIVGQDNFELFVITNYHVIENSEYLSLEFTDQTGQTLQNETDVYARIVGASEENDLAVLGVSMEEIPEDIKSEIRVARIGNSETLEVGDHVLAIGNALGYGQSVTSGYVSALDREIISEEGVQEYIQTDAAINPGNSGGALLNSRGELIGINSAKIASDQVEGIGFAIPISDVLPVLDQILAQVS